MDKQCVSPWFYLFVLVALVTHMAELIFSALLAYTLYQDVTYRDIFFSLTAGVIILPLVLVQLVSAIFLLRRRGDAMSGGEAGLMAVLHVLQLAFLWRHMAVLKKPFVLVHRKELRELFVLRLTFTFAGGFPLVLIQVYLLLTQAEVSWMWTVYASLVASALSVTWSMASLQQEAPAKTDSVTLWSWPASLFTWLWRLGEMVSRIVSLALFASLYRQWVLLVLGLHWLVMLLCLSLPQTAYAHISTTSPAHRVAVCLMTAYSYVWCYVSLSKARTAVWYTLYYVIMFLENCTLSIVWLTKTEVEEDFTSKYLLVLISTLAFLVSMACLFLYYKHFYLLPPPEPTFPTTATATSNPGEVDSNSGACPACHHGTKHHPHQQPPYPSGWTSQYYSALTAGQYYKHTMHDSLLDSASDMTCVVPHHCRRHLKVSGLSAEDDGEETVMGRGAGRERCACAWRGEGDGVSVVSCQTSRSANSCPHRRCLKTSRSDLTDSTSVLTLASGASQNLGYDGSDDTQSNTVPAWLPSGESLIAKHLMVPDTGPRGSVHNPDKDWVLRHAKGMGRYRCLLKQEAARYGSEGYSPRPSMLDWPQTHLSAPLWDLPPKDTHFSTCCCCSHLSPGDSEVSSTFKVAHTECCRDCERYGRGTREGLYGVPAQPLHHKDQHKDPSSSDSETTCPCCTQKEQHEERQGTQYHSQPNVFTISQQDQCCEADVPEQQDAKRCVSDSEGLSRNYGGLLKKSKHSEKKRQRDHSPGRTKRRLAQVSLVANTSLHHDLQSTARPAPESRVDNHDSAASKHIPSKLQVKAIAEKSDDNSSPVKSVPSSSPTGSEPIYENISTCIQENNQFRTTSNTLPEHVMDLKDKESLEVSQKVNTITKKRKNKEEASTKQSNNKEDNKPSGKHTDSKEKRVHKTETLPTKANKHSTERQMQEVTKKGKWSGPRGDNSHTYGGRTEPWYMCSESEDSALPPEIFSSSVDLDSDGSFELII